MADLGRYDEAAAELAAALAIAPRDPELLTTLARLHLVADQPVAALAAADRAVAALTAADPAGAAFPAADPVVPAVPAMIGPLVARAMALIDTRDFGPAAE